MTLKELTQFRAVWFVGFEVSSLPGERPKPVALVAFEMRSGRRIHLPLTDSVPSRPPFNIDSDSMFIAYDASVMLSCFLSLGWPMPCRVLDLYAEFRCLTNGRVKPDHASFTHALTFAGLSCPGLDLCEKSHGQNLGRLPDKPDALLDKTQHRVEALSRLFERMKKEIDLPRALFRGQYARAVATMEHEGVPIDPETLRRLRRHWPAILESLIKAIDPTGEVYQGSTFKADRWRNYLLRHRIPWPHGPDGSLLLDDDTFRQAAKRHPMLVGKWHELRHTLGKMRSIKLAVGNDGRNRSSLKPYGAKTGRNQPSSSEYIFGPSAWQRNLIKPDKGRAIAYVDWKQQEFGIAAALSNDVNMKAAYRSGDPYLTFAKQAKAVPESATKESHAAERALFKECALGVQYGMGANSLAVRISKSPDHARELLELHRRIYPDYWKWSQSAVDCAMLHGQLQTVFGWRLHVDENPNTRSLANFPCQANGAEILRLACCMMVDRGIGLCASIHDAVLIEGPATSINQVVSEAQSAMREASAIVLNGFELETDAEVVCFPDRYSVKRGADMWAIVMNVLQKIESTAPSAYECAEIDLIHT